MWHWEQAAVVGMWPVGFATRLKSPTAKPLWQVEQSGDVAAVGWFGSCAAVGRFSPRPPDLPPRSRGGVQAGMAAIFRKARSNVSAGWPPEIM